MSTTKLIQDVNIQLEKELLKYIDIKNLILKRLNNVFLSYNRRKQLQQNLEKVKWQIQRRDTKVIEPIEITELDKEILKCKIELNNPNHPLKEIKWLKNRIKILEERQKNV